MINHLWSTPFMKDTIDGQLNELMVNALLLDYNMNNPPSDFGSINVLDSDNANIIKFKNEVVYPAFDTFLTETLGRKISDWKSHKMKAWIANSRGVYNINYHNHRGAQISAVFYLLCDDVQTGGEIHFTDPRQNSNRGYDASFTPWFNDISFVPKSQDFVVFPSFLYHYVTTYQGNTRLALPVDLFLHEQQ